MINKKIFKFYKLREIEGWIKQVILKGNSLGEYLIFFVTNYTEVYSNKYAKTGKTDGFDFGLKNFLIISDGEKIDSPLFLNKDLKKLRNKSRNFFKKIKGSNNRRKAREDLARLHIQITKKRDDWQWKLADRLVREYDIMFFEDLNMNGMKKLWGRKISNLSLSSFLKKLEHLCLKMGKKIVKIGRFQKSTGVCPSCNHKVKLELSDRDWSCVCGLFNDRDIASGLVINKFGHQLLNESESDCDDISHCSIACWS